MRTLVAWSAATMIVLGVSVASAADKPQRTPEEMFKRLDANSDGKLTVEEFTAKREGDKAEKAKKYFARIDKNSDGSVDLEEFKAAMEQRKK